MQALEAQLERVRAQLGDTRSWGEDAERVVDTGIEYGDGSTVEIHVRKRGIRYDLDDAGVAIARARSLGAPADWLEVAERIVAGEGFNVNRRGVVFVPLVEGRDIAGIALRLGESAYAVHSALLEAA